MLAEASRCTFSRGRREGVRAWETVGLGLEDEESPEALRAACFFWAMAIGDWMSLMCLSMKTGFLDASLSFWKSRRGFSS